MLLLPSLQRVAVSHTNRTMQLSSVARLSRPGERKSTGKRKMGATPSRPVCGASHSGAVSRTKPVLLQNRVCLLFVGCITSQQHACVSQGRICSDKFTCCHTEIEVADQTFYLTQSQYTDTGLTSPSADPITPGAWQGSHWSVNFEVTGMTRPRKNPGTSGIPTRDVPLSRRTP